MMHRSRSATFLRRLQGSCILPGSLHRVLAPQLHPLIASTRHGCIRSTRVRRALSHRRRLASLYSDATPMATAGRMCSVKSPSEPPSRPHPDFPTLSRTVAATAPEKVAPSTTAAERVTNATSRSASDTPSQLQSPSPLLQDSLVRRLLASWQQGVVASIGAVMGIGFLVYFLYIPVKEDTVHHTAVVASEALADARLKGQAVQLSKDVVVEVLRNPKSLDATVDVVVELLAREETKIAVSSLLQSLFEDHYTQEVTKKFVLRVVQDPWIQDQLQVITEEQVRKLLNNAAVKSELSKFLLMSALDSLEKPQLHYEVARAIRLSAASLLNFWWS
ncbi:hypothetical protein LSCM4_01135 [Leishmania orientalis]|uniref:Uncharacterized protein n=1 Tax=Leishmania orientalis TaxID=2249476 RepID=A0A836GI18_9TRYP|nr:hypothetical protein LSCM4_01135 [Leishmania orientalis]